MYCCADAVLLYVTVLFALLLTNSEQTPESESESELLERSTGGERPATNQPQFISTGGHLQVKEGQDVELSCDVDDLGEFVILWKFNRTQVLFAGNLRIHRDDRISRDDTKGSLLIRDFRPENVGEYTCQVSTNPPQDIVYNIAISGPPMIRAQPENGQVVVKKNDTIRVSCDPINFERIMWRRAESGRTLNVTSPELVVERARSSDSGLYECIALNSIGQTSFKFRVSVLFAPEVHARQTIVHAPIGQSVEIACTIYAEPAANVVWFNRNSKILPNDNFLFGRHNQTSTLRIANVSHEHYDNYTCIANNTLGSGVQTIQVTGRPSRPKFLSAPLTSDRNSYVLEWTTDSQTKITAYELRLRRVNADAADSGSPGGAQWQHLQITPNEESSAAEEWQNRRQAFRIEGLSEDANYELDLVAHNQFGSTRSHLFSFVTSLAVSLQSPALPLLLSLLLIPILIPFLCSSVAARTTTR